MLDNNFFNIIEIEKLDEINTFVVEINSEHKIFEGHFPNMAVMPGVCSLMIIKKIASKISGKSLQFSHIMECKFISAIMPKDDNILKIRFSIPKIDENSYKINAIIECNDNIVMKLKANLREIYA